MAANKSLNLFHIDLKTAFLQEQFYGVTRDVVCQLPPEAGHPPCIAARLKKPACGMNDATRRWWNVLDKAPCSYGVIPTRSDRCCMCCTQPKRSSQIGTKSAPHMSMVQMTSHSNRLCHHREMQHFRKRWIPLKEAQLQTNPWLESQKLFVDDLFGTGATEMEQRILGRLGKDFQVGSEDWNDVLFTRQGIRWMKDPQIRTKH